MHYIHRVPSLKRRITIALCALTIVSSFLVGCDAEETDAQAQISYDRNVESCVCRMLAFEADSYSGLDYNDMIEECNKTVRSANPKRYPSEFHVEMEQTELRCPEDLEDWQEALEETRTHQKVSRDRFQEFTSPAPGPEAD